MTVQYWMSKHNNFQGKWPYKQVFTIIYILLVIAATHANIFLWRILKMNRHIFHWSSSTIITSQAQAKLAEVSFISI